MPVSAFLQVGHQLSPVKNSASKFEMALISISVFIWIIVQVRTELTVCNGHFARIRYTRIMSRVRPMD